MAFIFPSSFPADFCFVSSSAMEIPSFMEASLPLMADHGTAVHRAIDLATKLHNANASPLNHLDKTAVVCLATMQEVFPFINKLLFDAASKQNNTELGPWIKLLRLLSVSINQLPNACVPKAIYHEAQSDVTNIYKDMVGQVVAWPTFTSGVSSMEALAKKQGSDAEKRSIFVIEPLRAKDIKVLSPDFGEDLLLMATTRFQVTKVSEDSRFTLVHLKEVDDDGYYSMLAICPPETLSVRCDRHIDEDFKFVCHDCGDKLVCNICIQSCPQHKNRTALAAAAEIYKQNVQSNLGILAGTKQDLQQGLEDIQRKINEEQEQKENKVKAIASMFDKYKADLEGLMAIQLDAIENASKEKMVQMTEGCSTVSQKIEEIHAFTNASASLFEKMNDHSVESPVAAYQAYKNTSKIINSASGMVKQLLFIKNELTEESDESDDALQKQLEVTLEQLKEYIKISVEKKKNIHPDVIESVCGRFKALTILCDVLEIVGAVLSKPATHEPVLRELAKADPELFSEIAAETHDKLEEGERDGYPMTYVRDSDRENQDMQAEVEEFIEDIEEEEEEEEEDEDEDEDEDTDIEDVLTEEDEVEEYMRDNYDAKKRAEARKRCRSGDAPGDIMDLRCECENEREVEEEKMEEVMENEPDIEAEETLDTMRAQLEEIQEELIEKEAIDPEYIEYVDDEQVKDELEEMQEIIDGLDEEADQKEKMADAVKAAVATLQELMNAEGDIPAEVLKHCNEQIQAAADKNMSFDCDDDDDDDAPDMEEMQTMLDGLRSALDELVQCFPNLKRKRDEYEAISEMRREFKKTDLIIDRVKFRRLVQEIGQDYRSNLIFTDDAMAAFQEATEAFMVEMFQDANLGAIHADRTHILPKDIKLVRDMKKDW